MYKLVICTSEPYAKAFCANLSEDEFELHLAEKETFVDSCIALSAEFLVLQVLGAPAYYRQALMRLYKAGCAPHIVIFSLGAKNQLASSSPMGKSEPAFDDALSTLYRTLLLSALQVASTVSGSFQFVECSDIALRSARFIHDEHLREILSGVTREQYLQIIQEQNLNLAQRGHHLIVTKAMPYDYFDDYTHNRRVYYLLDELVSENVRNILGKFAGGEIFEANTTSKCIIINDFHRVSQRRYTEDFKSLISQLRAQIDDGMTAFLIGRRVDEPEEFNNVYRECINAKRMRIFYGEEKVLSVSVLKQKRELPDFGQLEGCLSALKGYTATSDDGEMAQNINRLFLQILKPSANINMYYYSCSALNVIYDTFCTQYDIETEHRAMSRCFDKYVTVEEIAEHYINIFRNARQRVLTCYGQDSLLAFQMTSFIQRNYCRDITLFDLAEYVGFSRSYTSKCFHQLIGTTFSDYLTSYRIEKAKELLYSPSRMKIGDIAAAVGYQNSQFFARMFRQKTGVSPTEYAANPREK